MTASSALRVAEMAKITKRLMALGYTWNKAVYEVAKTFGLTKYEIKELGQLTKP